jgi:predicted RNase H-like HicB family nuclease
VTTLTAYIERDPDTGLLVGMVPGVPGAHSQGATLDELTANLREVIDLLLEEDQGLRERPPRFVGLQQIEMA